MHPEEHPHSETSLSIPCVFVSCEAVRARAVTHCLPAWGEWQSCFTFWITFHPQPRAKSTDTEKRDREREKSKSCGLSLDRVFGLKDMLNHKKRGGQSRWFERGKRNLLDEWELHRYRRLRMKIKDERKQRLPRLGQNSLWGLSLNKCMLYAVYWDGCENGRYSSRKFDAAEKTAGLDVHFQRNTIFTWFSYNFKRCEAWKVKFINWRASQSWPSMSQPWHKSQKAAWLALSL